MALTDEWKAHDWHASEFSYATPDLLAALRRSSQHDVTKLLRAYRRQYWVMLGLSVLAVAFLFLQPHNPQYLFAVGLIVLYCAVQVGYLTLKFRRFQLPDLSQQTAEAIAATLRLVRAINAFQIRVIVYAVPLVFLGSLLATLSYGDRDLSVLLARPVTLAIVIGSTAAVVLVSSRLRPYLASRQCVALIARLEASQRELMEG